MPVLCLFCPTGSGSGVCGKHYLPFQARVLPLCMDTLSPGPKEPPDKAPCCPQGSKELQRKLPEAEPGK